MNYSILNRKEVLRLAEPETDLEIVLVKLLDEDFDELDDALSAAEAECDECSGLSCRIEDLEDSEEDLEGEIKELKALLDKNDIDYSDI